MRPITIAFESNNLGRVLFDAKIQDKDKITLNTVRFKLDSGSDFTTLSYKDLRLLGFKDTFLEKCPHHEADALNVNKGKMKLQYIENITFLFGNRSLKGCRVFFEPKGKIETLFGSDILKYFNYNVNYEKEEITLEERKNPPELSPGEKQIQIYSLSTE